ncbi:hypothetical protein [Hyalangium versicolor]|uniref:hypothetical protein n=1 Tax=Hyalangium versicolor TaxID=2861190 RepID=UPI001CCF825F|nr:hypothetical protein [Hyalangium versicolor]
MQKAAKNLVTLLVLVLVALVIYIAAKVVPFYVDNMDVEEAVSASFTLAGQTQNDGALRAEIRSRTTRMGTHVETDSWGVDHVVPGLGLTDDQIDIERSRVYDDVRIQVTYQREVDFALFNHTHVLEFRVVREGVPPR